MGVLRRAPEKAHAGLAVIARLGVPAGAILVLACGGATSPSPLPGASGRVDPIYDALVHYPQTEIIINGLPHRGLEFDLEIRFADATVRDDDPVFLAEARIVRATAGGLIQPFGPAGAIGIEGTLTGDIFTTGLFGPVQIGNAVLFLDLTGTLQAGRRLILGQAELFGLPDPGSFEATRRRRFLVAGTDLQVIGKTAILEARHDALISITQDVAITSSDPVARVEDGRPFVVNGYTYDNLQGFDPATFLTGFQYTLGEQANPHDLAVWPQGGATAAGGFAFVPRYEPPFNDVAVMDLGDGAIVDAIDLSPYARNPDHLPRPDQVLLHDGLLYVTLQDANLTFTQFMNGRVVVIDPEARQVVGVIDLLGQNPFQSLQSVAGIAPTGESPDGARIFVGLAGIFPGLRPQALTGGVEAIDPVERTTSLLVDDDLLGGNVSAVAIDSPARGYCVVTDSSYRNFVKMFDPTTGTIGGAILETTDFVAAIEADGAGWLVVGESGSLDPRLLIFDAERGTLLATVPVRLPPFSIATLTRSL